LTWEECISQCPQGVVPACHNAEDSVTISGPQVIKEPRQRSFRWVSTSIPQSEWDSPLAMYSSADYHVNNLLSPVLFQEALSLVPENAVVAILKRSLKQSCSILPLMKRGHANNLEFFLSNIGKIYMNGGKLQWTGNWVTFLDTMLQMMVVGIPGRTLRLPTRIRSVYIDPAVHLDKVCGYNDEMQALIHRLQRKLAPHGVQLPVSGLPGDSTDCPPSQEVSKPCLERLLMLLCELELNGNLRSELEQLVVKEQTCLLQDGLLHGLLEDPVLRHLLDISIENCTPGRIKVLEVI
ncbi:hypothetical protein XENOCAPTIV_000317, partial [Xenoophorus captivus]